MRCLYCGKQLALLRRLTGGGEFCSESHKQSYHDEYNRLALSRLMNAQTRPDENATPESPAGNVSTTLERSQDERGWTAVNGPSPKRLNAPKETGPTAGRNSPTPRDLAGFLTSRSPFPEFTPAITIPKLETIEFSLPSPTRPGYDGELIGLSFATPAAVSEPVAPTVPEAGLVTVRQPLAARQFNVPKVRPNVTPLLESTPKMTVDPGLAMGPCSSLPTLEFSPVPLDPIAPEAGQSIVQSQLQFDFPREVAMFLSCPICLPGRPGGTPASVAERTPAPSNRREPLEPLSRFADAKQHPELGPLRYLRPIELRPAPPPKAAPVIPFAQIAPSNTGPTLPTGTPIPVRRKIAQADEGARHSGLKLAVATPGGLPDKPPIQDRQERHRPSGSRRSGGAEKSGKVWGVVQKYIRNLVGCMILAALSLAISQDLSAETRRAIHQLFIYPESLALPDYRIEIEPDAGARITDLVFRAADPENYYALQISGPPSQRRMKRFTVVHGDPGPATVLPLPGNYGSALKILLEVSGPRFRVYANAKLVEAWEDQRFTRGGFGFFSDGGAPPVKSLRVSALISGLHR